MTYKLIRPFLCALTVSCLLIDSGYSTDLVTGEQWQDPFRSGQNQAGSSSDSLSLASVLGLVAKANPTLKVGLRQIQEAEGLLTQAGLRPNPELAVEAEEVGWDAPGFSESEITVLLSQEIELWGSRKNRKQVARRALEAVQLGTRLKAFDIYATTIERYYTLSHAQRRVALVQDAVDLAADIVESARVRVNMGAAMQAELLLGELEMETAKLELAKAISQKDIARTALASLWKSEATDIVVAEVGVNLAVMAQVDALQLMLEGSRAIRTLEAETALTEAELNLQRSGAKPNISLSGGYKRLEANGSNSFVLGVGLPLPFFNKNQGNIRSLEARKDALKLSREQALVTSRATFETSKRQIKQQVSRFQLIQTQVLPKAQETYLSLKSAYEKGKLPYSILLEAQRLLLDLRFELNDIGLTIKQEIVILERLLGVTVQ